MDDVKAFTLQIHRLLLRHSNKWFSFEQFELVEEAIANNWNEIVSISPLALQSQLWPTTHPNTKSMSMR